MLTEKQKYDRLYTLIQEISSVESTKEAFDLICKISAATESFKDEELRELSHLNDLYVGPIWNVFHNNTFLRDFKIILDAPYEEVCAGKFLKEQQTVQLFLRISFFMVSVLIPVLREETVFFLGKQFGISLKHLYTELSGEGDMHRLLSILEDINFDAKYRFEIKTPVNLNTNFLNMNQISSRILIGFLILAHDSYWTLPQLFNDIVKNNKHPNKLFKVARHINRNIGEYQKYDYLLNDKFFSTKRKEELISFNTLLKDQNIEDLIYLICEVGPDYRPDYYGKSIEKKVEIAEYIQGKVQKRFETLGVFTAKGEKSGQWSNKAFLNTIAFFSVLQSIKKAMDASWKKGTFEYFLSRWVSDMHEIINYHDIENSETTVIYVEGLSDKLILEKAYEKLHPKHNGFIFYHVGGRQELYKKINAAQINDFERKSIGIFDFDEAYGDFNGLRNQTENSSTSGFCDIQGEESLCLFRTREDNGKYVLAILLPVPHSRKNIASKEFGDKSLLSIEMLFEDDLLEKHGHLGQKTLPGGTSVNTFIGDKIKFAEKTNTFNKSDFKNFEPLFKHFFETI